MSCDDFKQNIYLYEELSSSEKESLDAHLQTCASCAAVLAEVKGTRVLIKQMADDEIVPPNAARLTSGIMSKIVTDKPVPSSAFALSLFGQARIALTALSILLLLTFAIEFLRDPTQLRRAADLSVKHAVLLDSKNFRDNFSHGKVKHHMLADCGGSLKMGQTYLDCLKSKLK